MRIGWNVLAIGLWLASLGSSGCSSTERAREPSEDSVQLSSELLRAPLRDTADRPLVLADELSSGKKVALVFWQAWCGSCRAEAPELVAASRKYPGIEFIGVVSGPDDAVDAAALERAIRDLRLPYRNVRDRDLELTNALDITVTPTIVVLGSHGDVLYRGHELPDWDALL